MKSYGPINVLIWLSWPVGGSDCRKAKEPTRWCVDVFPGKKQWPWCSACCVSLSAGVNRHFHMICIRDKFSQNIGRQVSSSVIWDHLGTMYDMQALVRTHTCWVFVTCRAERGHHHWDCHFSVTQHESEILPFPNNEKSFSLPDDIIQEVKEGEGTAVRNAAF